MARNIVLLLFFIGLNPSLAQKQLLKIDYELYLNGFAISKTNSELFVADDYSVFIWNDTISSIKEDEFSDGQIKFGLHVTDSLGTINYYSKRIDSLLSRSIGFDGVQILKEKRTHIDWKLHPEVKTIGEFDCSKATCSFRGRHYEVWYTPEVPVFYGPWKLHGLPGLVMEVRDIDGMFHAFFKKFSYSEKDIGSILNSLNTGQVITIKEYAERQNNLGDELLKRMKLSFPRELNVSVDGIKQERLERDFN